MNNKVQKFVNHVKFMCKSNNVKFIKTKYNRIKISNNEYVSGYFQEGNRQSVLVVAGKNKRWLETLVHEYSHLLQSINMTKEWTKSKTKSGKDAWYIMNDHLMGKSINQKDINEAYKIVIQCEKECDKQAVKIIRQFNLPINTKVYIKKSNAYHYYHHFLKETGNSKYVKPLYENKKLISLCPSTFRCQSEKFCPKKIFKEIKNHIENS